MLRLKSPLWKRCVATVSQPELRPVLILAALYFLVMLAIGWHRYFTYFASYDQGIFNQVFWNGSHGRFFQSSLSSVLSTNVVHDGQFPAVYYHRLGQHFTPALLLWLPLYKLFPFPPTLTFIQVSLITGGGLVLYALARHYLQPAISFLLMAGYYGANGVIGPTFSNFHDLCQIPIFIFTLLLAMEKRIWWLFWLMACLTVIIRQDAGVTLFGVGVYLIVSRRYPKTGLAVCTLAFGYVVVATNVFMPMFSEDISRRFMMERFGQYASGDRASTLEILWAIISNPVRLLANVFGRPEVKIPYLLVQALPLAFVSLVAPFSWVIAGFPMLQLFLQKGSSPLSIHIRYAMTLVPGLFYGAILWWSTHSDRFKFRFQRFWQGCILVSALIAICYNPHDALYFIFPTSYNPWVHVSLTRQWEHTSHLEKVIHQIPPDASVTATTYIVPHVSGRREVLRAPYLEFQNDQRKIQRVDYLVADMWQLERYQIVFKLEQEHFKQLVPLIKNLVAQNQYGIVAWEDGVILLQQGVPSKPELLAAWQQDQQRYESILGSQIN